MENKRFSIEHHNITDKDEEGEERSYKRRILSVVNGGKKVVHAPKIHGGTPLHNLLEERKHIDSRKEVLEYEPIREEICETFGVIPYDEEHVWIREVNEPQADSIDTLKQRAFRIFCVLINTEANENFYGEGRMAHKEIFERLAKKASDRNLDIDKFGGLETYIKTHPNEDPPKWVWVKGFLSKDNFSQIPNRFRKGFEKCIVDENGDEISTPENWFTSGGSLSSR